MAAQVEVQTAEVGRTVAGGRHHLSPLTDSSNKSLIEIPSVNQPHIIASEPSKPVPGPKPRLTPKPFSVEKNTTIKPILAPKPQTKPRPESTRLAGYKPELPSSLRPQLPATTSKPRPVLNTPNRPASTTFKTSSKLHTGQTVKPVVQPFKPAPPLDTGDVSRPPPPVPAERQKPRTSGLALSKSFKNLPAAEWFGSAKKEDKKGQNAQGKGGTSLTRAKSMGFLLQVGQEEEGKEKAQPETSVPLRPHPRGSRPRPVSAIFPGSPTKTDTPVSAPRWTGRRPLSADLTSKFESIGLSLHRKGLEANTKENTPEGKAKRNEDDKTLMSSNPRSTDDVFNPVLSDESNKNKEEVTVKETDEDKRGVTIKSRISLLLDSPTSPGVAAMGQGSDVLSPVQAIPETEPPVGVKQLIKQLTEDTTLIQSPVLKPALKPRPLPLDLTKRFSSERSPNPVSHIEAMDCHDISKDPQRRAKEESAITPSDQKTFLDLKDSQEQLKKVSLPEESETGQPFDTISKERSVGSGVQTVRASLFENFVERHSVLMMDENASVNAAEDLLSSPSLFKRGIAEDNGTLVTATYRQPLSPSSPLPVLHAFDTVQAVEENCAVSESVLSAQREDKAMTLRSRRSEGSRPVAERTGTTEEQPALATMPETRPRYLRIGALQKWTTTGLDQDIDMEKGMRKESQREGQVALDKDRDRQRVAQQEEVAAAPKPLKTLQAEETAKPKATYFALTGQIQEPVFPGSAATSFGDMPFLFDDSSGRSALVSSQGKSFPIRGDLSLEDPFGKTTPSQEQVGELMWSHMPPREIRSALEGKTKEERIEVEKKGEQKKETERPKASRKELEREQQKQLEIEKQAHLDFARMKELEMQREFERQRQKTFEEEKQRAVQRQKQTELEKAQELEREKQRLEREKQRKLEKEKRQEIEKEQQRALEKQYLLEIQKQNQKERERQQLMELEKQRLKQEKEKEEAEKLRQMALEQEMLRIKELEKEQERQKEIERERQRELEKRRQRELEKERQRQLDKERQELENQRLRHQEQEKGQQRQREEELQRELEKQKIEELERQQLLEIQRQKHKEKERQQLMELEKQRLKQEKEKKEAEKLRQMALELEMLRIKELEKERERQKEIENEHQKEIEREKQRELEKRRQHELEKERQRQLDKERRELENQRLRQQEQEKERKRKEDLEKLKEMERLQLLEFEKKQAELERHQTMELENHRLREKMEREEAQKREQAEKLRVIAKQQEAERQRLKEKQRKEEQERLNLESLPLMPKVLDLDSVHEKQRLIKEKEKEEAEKLKQMALEQEMLRIKELEKERERQKEIESEHQKEIEREKQRELEKRRQRELEKERQRQLDKERQELENQRLRQQEQEKERKRKEDLEKLKEMERLQLLEFEKKQAELERHQTMELEHHRLREKMEREEAQKREQAEKLRVIAKQQEAERQRLKEKQRKEEQERLNLESLLLRPKVLDLDSVLRNDSVSKATPQRSDAATRWKEPYKPSIVDKGSFTQAQIPPNKESLPISGIQGLNAEFGDRLQTAHERDGSCKIPPQTSVGFSSPVWTTPPQDPWELRPVEMSVDQPKTESRNHANKHNPGQLLLNLEESGPARHRPWSAILSGSSHLATLPGTEVKSGSSPGRLPSSTPAEQIWLPRELQPEEVRGEVLSHRRSQGSRELNRLRSRSVSRRSAPAGNAVEGSLSRMRSRSAHREQDRHSWVQQKQSVSGEEEGKDSETPVRETDSQYGTWETGLRTDDSLTPATPSSESALSPSSRKPTPAHTPGDHSSQFESDTLDGLPPSSSSDSQPLSFPDAPTTLLDNSALRARAQLGKKRAPRTRPTRAPRQSAAQTGGEGGTNEDWLYRDSTEAKAESKDDDSDSEEQPKGADAKPAIASQPQRVALFPGMDPSALKAQLKKRSDSDNQIDGPAPSPSQLSRSPKSPFLPRAARVLPPPGGKENGEEDSPQWLKELKSKKRLSQYENES